MSDRLEDKVAIVTGASRGIGAAVALDLARRGSKVVIAARTREALDEVAQQIEDAGGEALAVTADMMKALDLDRIVADAARRFDGIDILVNNAGMAPGVQAIQDGDVEDWDEVMAVNLRAPWYLSKRVYPSMKTRGGGAIVNVSSNSGLHHDFGLGAYGTSKAGLIWLTNVCAKEWARDKIRVNCVAPGLVRTVMAEGLISYLESRGRKPNPLDLIGEPEDIAKLVGFLASDDARYITGEVVRIDGGEIL